MEACCTKHYSDACVQTAPNASATRLQDSATVTTTPVFSRLKRVTYIDQTASGECLDDSVSRRVYPRTPINRMKAQVSLGVPNQVLSNSPSVPAEPQRRVVSFPEQLAPEVVSQKLANSFVTSSRNVSMPASIQQLRQTGLAYEEASEADFSTSVSYEEEHSAPQNYAHASDLLYTPSLPSTPNSIEIIDGSFHLPDAFLRNQGHSADAVITVHKDWLTWSNSPPRPIPALHGPSSLPYARCPSGAEGTIIEEPSNVPGLIWGLKDNAHSAQTNPASSKHNKPGSLSRVASDQEHPQDDLQVTTCKALGRTSVNTVRALAHERLEMAPTPRLGKNGASPLGHSEPVVYGVNMQSGESPEFQNGLDNVAPIILNEQTALDSRINQHHYGQSLNLLFQQQLCQVPDSLLHAILRERIRKRNDVALISCSGLGHPDMPERSTDNQNMETTRETGLQGYTASSVVDDSSHTLRQRDIASQNTLPTPPDSASPLWLPDPSPQPGIRAIALERPSNERPRASTSQLYGLNLHAPAETLESLSDQLKRLILRQQTHNGTSSSPCDRDPTPCPFHEQGTSAPPTRPRSNTVPSVVAPRPEMPINLQDLVVRHMREQSPVEASSSLLPSVVPTTHQVSEHRKSQLAPGSDADAVVPPSNDCNEQNLAREGVLSGKRHPRSIPLTRLLGKKLPPVPEETSFVSTTQEEQNQSARPILAPILTTVKTKKDYDFTELRSPLEETMTEESRCSQIEPSDHADRKVLQPSKQRTQQVKQKGQNIAGGKATPSMVNERKNKANDENVHEPHPSSKAPIKKGKLINKNTRAGARGFAPQKSRR